MKFEPAPVVLFAFNRPEHTQRTIDALRRNELASQSELIVYSDAARSEVEQGSVQAARAILRSITGFKTVTVIERERNYGLAKNIIEGVAEVVDTHGRVIVLEDDIVTSPYFLRFMNDGLEAYADDRRVWHISGWNYPINTQGLGEAFFWRVMNCWGWATWADRWRHFEKDPTRLVREWSGEDIKRFNLDGDHDFWGQIVANEIGEMSTWAIFWYASIFERNGLCLNATRSLVHNIGLDGSGQNCGANTKFSRFQHVHDVLELPGEVRVSEVAVGRIKEFYRADRTFRARVLRYISRLKSRKTRSQFR